MSPLTSSTSSHSWPGWVDTMTSAASMTVPASVWLSSPLLIGAAGVRMSRSNTPLVPAAT